MPNSNQFKKTHYGMTALVIAIFSTLSLAAYFALSKLEINPATFSFWNNLVTLTYCLAAPSVLIFLVLAWRSKNDARSLANFALTLILIPFFVLLFQFISSFSR